MIVTSKWLQDWAPEAQDAAGVREALTRQGLEVEGVHALAGDEAWELNVTPNRPDCLSALGVARDWRAARGFAPREQARIAGMGDAGGRIVLEDPGCPLYLGAWVGSVKVAPCPAWITARLEASGLRPLHPVVDILNYAMLDVGHPLHAFDLERLEGGRIVVRRGRAGEKLKALNGADLDVNGHLVIADASRPAALAGIIGGFDSGVSERTQSLLVEAAWFEPRGIRRSARALGLSTDSSYRFERGVDPHGPATGMARALELLKEHCGATGIELFAAGATPALPAAIHFSPERCVRFLHVDLSRERMAGVLEALGCAVAAGGDRWSVTPPSWRADLREEADLCEEILRITGINAPGPEQPPLVDPFSGRSPRQQLRERVRDLLTGQGFHEAVHYSFTSRDADALLGPGTEAVPLANPISEQGAVLRTALAPGLAAAAARAAAHLGADVPVRLFEVGHVFAPDGQGGVQEQERVGAWISGTDPFCAPGSSGRRQDLSDLTGLLDALAEELRLACTVRPAADAAPFAAGRRATVSVGGHEVGVLGELDGARTARAGVEGGAWWLDLELAALEACGAGALATMTPLARYPRVRRDFSLLVAVSTPWSALEAAVAGVPTPGNQAPRVSLLDLYTGKGVAAGERALTLRAEIGHPERTLREDEIESWSSRVLEALSACGAKLRGGGG